METTIPYNEAVKKSQALKSEARMLMADVERKSAPLNLRQRLYFEEWLNETFHISTVYRLGVGTTSSKIDGLIAKLKELE